MKLAATVSLSLATLLISLSAPLGLSYLPQSGLSITTTKAVATASIYDVQGSLNTNTSDVIEREQGNHLADFHNFNGTAGQQITISVRSQDFDTLLVLADKDAQALDRSDDISQNDSNSRIDITLPYTGIYHLMVTPYNPGEQGRYRLSVTAQ